MGLKKVIFILAFFLCCGKAWAYGYGPTCQWMRLHGKVETDPGFPAGQPVLLNVNYQLAGQTIPGILLSGYPLRKNEFFFVLAPFQETIEKAVFLPFRVSFDQAMRFQYFATAANGRYRSAVHVTDYKAEPVVKGGIRRCQTDLNFETLQLQKRR